MQPAKPSLAVPVSSSRPRRPQRSRGCRRQGFAEKHHAKRDAERNPQIGRRSELISNVKLSARQFVVTRVRQSGAGTVFEKGRCHSSIEGEMK
jgi:hypothetical protein